MKDLFLLDQHSSFPDKFYGVITGQKGLSAIPIYYYNGEVKTIFGKSEVTRTIFYTGFIPRTYNNEYAIPTIIITNFDLPLFGEVTLEPLYLVKIALEESTYDFIIAKLEKEKITIDKDFLKKILLEFFGIPSEAIIIESDYKAKAFLINANKNFINKFIVVKRT